MRWWSTKKEPISTIGSPVLDNVADMFEAGCMSLVLQALEKGETVKRFVSTAAASLATYNSNVSGSTVGLTRASGGRLVFFDEEVETYEKGSLVAWDEGVASVTFDGTNVRVEFATNNSTLYSTVYTNVSGTLHP